MSDVPLLLTQVTVHKGTFWFRDIESVCYSINPETAHEIIYHYRLLARSMKGDQRVFTLGPYRITKQLTATVELPLRTPRIGIRAVMVSEDWIAKICPLIDTALTIHDQMPNESFTLALNDEGEIIRTETDRQSIPPQKES